MTQVHNSYLYLVKKEDQYLKKIDKFNKPKNGNTRLSYRFGTKGLQNYQRD